MEKEIEPSVENDRIVAEYIAANLHSTMKEKAYHNSLKETCDELGLNYIGN